MNVRDDWVAQVHRDFFPFAIRTDEQGEFAGHSRFLGAGALRIGSVVAGPHSVWVSRANSEATRSDMVKLLWLQEGSASVERGAEGWQIHAGQWMAYAVDSPYQFHSTVATRFCTVVCHRKLLGLPDRVAQGFAPAAIDGLALIAQQTIQTALTQQLQMTEAFERVLVFSIQQSVLDLPGHDDREPPHGVQQRHVLAEARRLVQAHFHDPQLHADAIAARLGVSRRSLFTAFAKDSDSPGRYIQECRLVAARQQLLSTAGARSNLTALAMQVGFNDSAHFSRLYRKRFGEAPSETRAA